MEQRPRTNTAQNKRTTRRSSNSVSPRTTNARGGASARQNTVRTANASSESRSRSTTRTVSASSAGTTRNYRNASGRPNTATRQNKNKSSKKNIVLMILAALFVFCVVDHVMHHDEAYSGVHVGDIDCSGMTAEQIVATLESTYGESYEEKNVYVFVSEESEAHVYFTVVSEV